MVLEDLTGPDIIGDGLPRAVCHACRNILNRYHMCKSEVLRISSLIIKTFAANNPLMQNRRAASAPTQETERSRKGPISRTARLSLSETNARDTDCPAKPINTTSMTQQGVLLLPLARTIKASVFKPSTQTSGAVFLAAQPSIQCQAPVLLAVQPNVQCPTPVFAAAQPDIQCQTPVFLAAQSSVQCPAPVSPPAQPPTQTISRGKGRETKVSVRTAASVKSRILTGALENVVVNIVQTQYRSPCKSIMEVPDYSI
ncbi:hypothetical protein AGOR_G00052570 [Albula goreensis]|uniref:Uncharacterized protein n=1 Tax=Albula goreensis TaxID=1534307 RepID=A0A8T3DZ86_9TELE|nr:hypothetical protein AGOR_G00052570 [Albula goreensis]